MRTIATKSPTTIGRFRIGQRLGVGGMGVVYEAFDGETNERVALKTLPQVDAAALYRFKHEFRAVSNVVHRNLVSLHQLISSGDQWFFTMELVEGVSFLDYLRPGTASLPSEVREPSLVDRRDGGIRGGRHVYCRASD